MKIFGIITVWRHSDRGNISVPGADMNKLGEMHPPNEEVTWNGW